MLLNICTHTHTHTHTLHRYEYALDRFTRSLAAYFVATGVTGLGDRHQDNIMLASNGLFFHIDFGLCLGRKTQQLNVVRERYRGSLLTSGLMAVVCAIHGEGRDPKSHFKNLCGKALCVRGVRARSARISLFSFTSSEDSLVSITQPVILTIVVSLTRKKST